MRWFHIFTFPSYISSLEKQVKALEDTVVREYEIKDLEIKLLDLKKEFSFYRDKVDVIEKQFVSSGMENEIDKAGDDFIDVDENYRIPIVEGINMLLEGQPQDQAVAMKIYGEGNPGLFVKPKIYGSRQSKKKVN